MKILMPIAYFQPEQMSSSHLDKDLLSTFAENNVEVQVICPVPTRGISSETAKQYRKIKRETLYGGHVSVQRFWAPQEGKNPILRAFRYFWCNLRQHMLCKKHTDADALLVSSTPPTQGWMGGMIKDSLRKKNGKQIPMIFNLQDIFPDSLVNANMTQEGSVIWKLGRKIENSAYSHADKIIVISEGFKKNIMSKGVPEEKIAVIPNWVDTKSVYPIERKDNVLFDRYGLDRNKFYICYSGNVGHSQNLQLLLDTASVIQTSLPDVRFVIIGEGAAKEELEAAIEKRKLDNMILLPFQPYDEIAHVFSLGDAGLIISKPGIGGSSVPSKTWSVMAAGRPVLASFDDDSELSQMVRETGCGIAVQAGDGKALISAIAILQKEHEKSTAMGQAGRTFVQNSLNKKKCTSQYLKIISGAVC